MADREFQAGDRLDWLSRVDGLSGTAMHVLTILVRHADAKTLLAWPSKTAMCQLTKRDESTVFDALRLLVERGLIADSGQRSGRTRQVIVWRVNCDSEGMGNPNSWENPMLGISPDKGVGFPNEKAWEIPRRTGEGTGKGTGERAQKRPPTPADASSRSPKRKGNLLPDDFQVPDDWLQKVVEVQDWSMETARREAQNFIDHYTAGAGKNRDWTDWYKAWRNWCRKPFAGQVTKPNVERGGTLTTTDLNPNATRGRVYSNGEWGDA